MRLSGWLWSKGSFATIRQFLSSEGRLINAVVLGSAAALLAFGAWYAMVRSSSPAWIGLLVIGLLVAAFLISGRFSAKLVRLLLVLGIVIILLGLMHLGRQETKQRRFRQAGATATSLASQVDEAAASHARNALDKLDSVIDALPPTSVGLAETKKVASDLRALLGPSWNDQALVKIQQRIEALDQGAVVKQARAAAAALTSALSPSAPSRAAADGAVKELCSVAGGGFQESPPPRVCKLKIDPALSLEPLNDRQAKAELEVARFRLAVAATDAKEGLAKEVDSKEAAYAKGVRARVEGVEDVNAADAVQAGAGAVLGALPWLSDNQGDIDVPVAVDVISWLLLAALAVFAYRFLERRAAARALGPVAVEGDQAHAEQFRTYVLRNIPDPGAVPGAAAIQPITDLLAATQVPAARMIAKALAAIIEVLEVKRGYRVSFEVRGAAKDEPSTKQPATQSHAGNTSTAVTVRVSKADDGELVSQKLVQDDTTDDALRKAAYWAAAVVLDRSDRVPRWAQWSSETSDSLAAFFSKEDLRQRQDELKELKELEEAVSRAPTSGVLCLELSNAYALKKEYLKAFELALRAAALHPHFVAGRYRLAMSASLVASDVGTNWWNQQSEQQARVGSALQRYRHSHTSALLEALERKEAGQDLDPRAPEKALCDFALEELHHIETLLDIGPLLQNSLRRSERAYWLAFLRQHRSGLTGRTQFRRAITSARPAIKQRQEPGRLVKEEEKWLDDPRTFWQVAYNFACYKAIRHGQGVGNAEEAIQRLEIAVERPNSYQLTQSWVETDPDLRSIRGDDRFKQFARNLHNDRRAEADASDA